MKTLDEVIKALELCSPHIRCDKACPYHKSGCLDYEMEKDALQYLKVYRENQQAYEEGNRKAEEARELYLEAVRNCELAENKYKRLYEGTSQNFATTSQNDPLTWDELQQMKGKPVWLEDKMLVSEWYILMKLDAFEPEEVKQKLIAIDKVGFCLELRKETQGTQWQAYRKERK